MPRRKTPLTSIPVSVFFKIVAINADLNRLYNEQQRVHSAKPQLVQLDLAKDFGTSKGQGRQLFQMALSILYVQSLATTLLSNAVNQLNTSTIK